RRGPIGLPSRRESGPGAAARSWKGAARRRDAAPIADKFRPRDHPTTAEAIKTTSGGTGARERRDGAKTQKNRRAHAHPTQKKPIKPPSGPTAKGAGPANAANR